MNLTTLSEKLDNSDDNTDVPQVSGGLKAAVALGLATSGTINLDWGGGRYDIGSKYMESQGVTNLVYDPFKRSEEHNQSVLKTCKEMKGADSATICNVLNVIPEKSDRLKCVKDAMRHLKSRHFHLIQVYERDKTGILVKTSKGYQLNQPLAFYKKELEEAGYEVESRKGFLVVKK